jgi:hypothetical protein
MNMQFQEIGGWVYVGCDISLHRDGEKLYKIGTAKDLDARERQHKTSNPSFHYLFAFQFANGHNPEKTLHARFASKRRAGEWFALTFADVEEIVAHYAPHLNKKEWLNTVALLMGVEQ